MGVGEAGVGDERVGSWVGMAFRGVLRNGGVALRGNGEVCGKVLLGVPG